MEERHTDPPIADMADDELLALVQAGGRGPGTARDALKLLFERHHRRVHAQCARLLGDIDLADDVTQEIFLALLDKPVRYESRQYFSSWLYVVVRNHCLNLMRRRRHEAQSSDGVEELAELLVDPQNPARELHGSELAGIVERACVNELTPKEREVVHLRYFWGLRVKEIDLLMGLTNVSGARSQLATAHRKLRRALTPHLDEAGLDGLLGEGEA